MRKIRELPGLQNLKVFAIADETTLKTVPSLPYDGIIPKVLAPEALREHLERVAFSVPRETQEPNYAPGFQAELKPVA